MQEQDLSVMSDGTGHLVGYVHAQRATRKLTGYDGLPIVVAFDEAIMWESIYLTLISVVGPCTMGYGLWEAIAAWVLRCVDKGSNDTRDQT
jgi:hypothetical protein